VPEALRAYEIIDGDVLVKWPTPMVLHQHVITELGYALMSWARDHSATVRVISFAVRTTATRRREPDLMVDVHHDSWPRARCRALTLRPLWAASLRGLAIARPAIVFSR